MGADNWTTCPKCARLADAAAVTRAAEVEAAYGKVPIEDFLKMRGDARNSPALEDTLREDYELGIRNGKFYCSYGASCSVCNFSFSFSVPDKTLKL